MDMGFTREHCVESLTSTTSLEQATEYILTHPPTVPPPVADAPPPVVPNPTVVVSINQSNNIKAWVFLFFGGGTITRILSLKKNLIKTAGQFGILADSFNQIICTCICRLFGITAENKYLLY